MKLKEFAEKLSGRMYETPQFTREELEEAKANGFVIITGASDDLMEIDGAICDEAGVWNGGIVHIKCVFDEDGKIIGGTLIDGWNGRSDVFSVEAKWDEGRDEYGNIIAWTYETSVQHETFDIIDNGQIYCRGIVIKP